MKDVPLNVDLLRQRLSRRHFGVPLFYSERVESTNDLALEMLDRGFPEGTLVLAEEQTQGRGRRGRTWVSPPRRGIYASLLLRPSLDVSRLPLVAFAASLGIARALEEEMGRRVEIKWPNDLLVGGKKVAGLLAEARSFEERPALVVGLGLNVHQSPEDFPEDFRDQVSSLALATGRPWDRTLLLPLLLERWEEEHVRLVATGGKETLSRWQEYSAIRDGATVRADLGGEILQGVFRGLTPSGQMRLEMEGGSFRRVAFGEVRQVRGG